uniref:Uncharacterized protein n=1 Tax=Panagrolaimus superbus TaxID=310955 RepID=A0A914YV23_9BILA
MKARKARKDLASARVESLQMKNLISENSKLKSKNEKLEERCALLNNRIFELEKTLNIVNEELAALKKDWAEKDEQKKVFLKAGIGFTPEANVAFGELSIMCGIPQDKVGTALLTIAKLFNVEVDSIPSARTVGRSYFAVSSICAKQIAELLEYGENLTVLSDETSKFFQKFQAFVAAGHNKLTGEEFLIYLGVFEVPDKSALRSLEELETVVKGIANTVGIDPDLFWKKFVISVKNLGSDRAATQLCFNRILAELRKLFLEESQEFNDMSEEDKAKFIRINSIFCILHIIQNLTKVVLKILLEHEKKETNNPSLKKSSIEWLIVEIARYFGARSAAKHRSARDWKILAEELQWEFANFSSFHGHRFNIIFVIASQILFNREKLIEFIEKYASDLEDTFKLATALKNPLLIMHLQILATIDSLITGAFWRLAENNDNFLKSKNYVEELLVFLNRVKEEPMLFFACEAPLDHFEDGKPQSKESKAFRQMLEDSEPIPGSSEVVFSLAVAVHSYFIEQFDFQLSDEFKTISEDEFKGAPSTNRVCEAAFGFLDYLFKRAPNMSTSIRSITIVARKNNVFKYLSSLSKDKYDLVVKEASEARSELAKKSQEKAKQLKAELVEQMERHALNRQTVNLRNQERLTRIREEVNKIGFWRNPEEMNESILLLSPRQKFEAVKANIRYRKFIHQVGFEPELLFRFSVNSRQHNLEALQENLCQLMLSSVEA